MTCQTAQLDYIGTVLYCAHTQQTTHDIVESAKRLTQANSSEHAWLIADLVLQQHTPRNARVAAFFLLLNIDPDLKERYRDMCPHKAGRFFQELQEHTVPDWLKNETRSLDDFVDDLKALYRNS